MSRGTAARMPITVLLAGLLCGCLCTDALAATGAISGQMTNGTTGVPGEVELYELEFPERRVATDTSGNFKIEGLEEGTYELQFIPEPASKYVSSFYHAQTTVAKATPIPVKAGATSSGVDEVVQQEARIEGTVTDTTGKPLEFVAVDLQTPSGEYVAFANTNEHGEYTLEKVPPGTYVLTFERFANGGSQRRYYHGAEAIASAEQITVTAGETLSKIDEALPALGTITGTITDAEGHGVQAAPIELFQGSSKVAQAYSKAGGAYEVPNLLPGSYTVRFAPPEHGNYLPQYYDDKQTAQEANTVTVSSGATTPSIDAQLATAGEVAGTITNSAGAPVAHATIILWDSNRQTPALYSESAENGTYSLPGLTTGTYYLEVSFGYAGKYEIADYHLRTTRSAADPIAVTTGSVDAGVDVQVAPVSDQTSPQTLGGTGQITGRVTGPASEPENEALVTLLNGQGHVVAQSSTIADGTYTFVKLPAGSYHAKIEGAAGQNLAPVQYPSPVSVVADTLTPGVDTQLQSGGSIAGTVDGASAGPLQGIKVTVYRSGAGGLERVGSALTGTGGQYSVAALAAGSYEVGFTDSSGSGGDWVPQFYGGAASASEAAAVAVTQGQVSSGVDATLASGGRLSGKVETEGGTPLEGVRVEALTPEGGYVAESDTLPDGSWEIGDLQPGSYIVHFVAEGKNVISQFYPQASSEAAAQQVTVTAGGDTGGLDVKLAGGSEISGEVNAGEAHVSVLNASGVTIARTQANASGEYEVPGLPEGSYTVRFEPLSDENLLAQYYKEAGTFATATFVQVSPGHPATAIDGKLEEGATVSGTVTAGSEGLAGVRVVAFDEAGAKVSAASSTGTGHYDVEGLAPGSYRLEFIPESGSEYASSYYSAKSTLAAASEIKLTAHQQVSNINEALSPQAASPSTGTIEGTVTSVTGAPLSGVEVDALSEAGEVLASTVTQSGGQYSLAGLLPGGYYVEFQPPASDELGEFYRHAGAGLGLSEADLVPITAGKVTGGIDVAIETFSSEAQHAPQTGGGSKGPTAASVSTTATSTTTNTPAGAASAGTGTATLIGSKRLPGAKGTVKLELACSHTGACAGTVSLLVYLSKRGAPSSKPIKGARTMVLAHTAYSIASGARGSVVLGLSTFARRLLRTHKAGVPAGLTFASSQGSPETLIVTLLDVAPKPAKRQAKKGAKHR